MTLIQPFLDKPAEVSEREPLLLCIDDDPNVVYSLKRSFRPYAVRLLVAFNGKQGYWSTITTKPDLIITDIHMPSGNGKDLINWLRNNSVLRGIPLIAISGFGGADVEQHLASLGADAFLAKPLSFESLRELVCKYVPLKPRSMAHATRSMAT